MSVELVISFNYSYLNFIVGVLQWIQWELTLCCWFFLKKFIVLRINYHKRQKIDSIEQFNLGVWTIIHLSCHNVYYYFKFKFNLNTHLPCMYMHKDCKNFLKEKNSKFWLTNLNPNTYSYKIIHLHFTSYNKKKFKKIKTENHFKKQL